MYLSIITLQKYFFANYVLGILKEIIHRPTLFGKNNHFRLFTLLASAVCEAGALGTIAAATVQPEGLRKKIGRLRQRTAKPFAVNIPLRLASATEAIDVVLGEEVPIVVCFAGDTDTTVIGRFTGVEFRVLKNKRAREILALERQEEDRKKIDDLTIASLRRAVARPTDYPFTCQKAL